MKIGNSDSQGSPEDRLVNVLPETVNYHFTKACQMACKHCFAVFSDCGKNRLEEYLAVIRAIARAPLPEGRQLPRRLNFVGGEPTLYPKFSELVECALEEGLRVSIVTNGFDLVQKGLVGPLKEMELIGISIDSLVHATNLKIGRHVKGKTLGESEWKELFLQMEQLQIPLKINTTITRHNYQEDLSEFIGNSNPIRWKVFQAMPVDGQNEGSRSEWLVNRGEYDAFVERHQQAGVQIEAEPEEMMRGTYAMISPDGRFYDSTLGYHHYSDPITSVGVEHAWNQINFSADGFEERTQNYGDSAA